MCSIFGWITGPDINTSFNEYPEVVAADPSKTTLSLAVELSSFKTLWCGRKYWGVTELPFE